MCLLVWVRVQSAIALSAYTRVLSRLSSRRRAPLIIAAQFASDSSTLKAKVVP